MDTKFIMSYLDDNQGFSPKKYFVHKHSIYPSELHIEVKRRFNVNKLFYRLIEKFPEFYRIEKSTFQDGKRECKSFVLISEEKSYSIVFQYVSGVFIYFAKEIEQGLVCILNEIIESCYETSS